MNESSTSHARRQKRFYSWAGALLLVGILFAVNTMAVFLPIRWDTSEGRVYSISQGTSSLLKKLDDTLLIQIVYTAKLPPPYNLNERFLRDLLAEYKRASKGKIRIEYVDPSKSTEAKRDALSAGVMPVQLDVREKDRRELKECFMGLAMFYGDRKEALPLIQDTQGLEYEISQRIKKLLNPERPKLGIVINDKALSFSDESLKPLADASSQLYDVVSIDLDVDPPYEVETLWVIGPREMSEAHAARLEAWVAEGRTLGLLLDRHDITVSNFRTTEVRSGLEDLLKKWGVELRAGLIVDPQCDRIQVRSVQGIFQMINLIDYPFFPFLTDLNRDHPATKGMDGIALPFVSPLLRTDGPPGVQYSSLARTSPNSWLDANPFSVSPLDRKMPPGEALRGPFDAAMLLEGLGNAAEGEGKKNGRVIVIGNSRFVRSDFMPRASNYTFFLNLLDWSVQEEALLSIRAKGMTRRPLKAMSDPVRAMVKYAMVLLLPIGVIVVGLLVWRRQKIRRALLPMMYSEV